MDALRFMSMALDPGAILRARTFFRHGYSVNRHADFGR
jgi:hypothetical protein